MSPLREVWVLPEIYANGGEISQISQGLLSEAREISGQTGSVTRALIFGDHSPDIAGTLTRFGIDKADVYLHPLLKRFSTEEYAAILVDIIRHEQPWLLLMGDTLVGRELGPKLVVQVPMDGLFQCVKMDLSDIHKPVFSRSIYGGQAYQEIAIEKDGPILVTMDTRVLNVNPAVGERAVQVKIFEPVLSMENVRARHLGYLPVDVKTMDIAEADVIVSAGLGAVASDSMSLAAELSGLIDGAIGGTRPVMDEGKIGRERMIGQTGKLVSPEVYLALGISGASHHLGGIQGSKTIVAVNRDSQADIFRNSDYGVAADLKDILPGLIEKIKQARKDGKIL